MSPAPPLPRKVGLVGLGLMGASLARAVRAADPSVRIAAVEPREEVRTRALADGVVDAAAAELGPVLEGCDLAVLCTPVAALEPLLAPASRALPDGAILTDVGGAKEKIVALARIEVRKGVRFVGAHPMFGGHGGYDGARPELWKGGAVAVCTDGDPEAVDRVAAFHEALGAQPVRCTAAEHDAAVAMVSHLPYLLASALAAAADAAGPLARRLAGPGLRDTTRLAAFPFDIQGEVTRRNSHIPAAAVKLEIQLQRILSAITASPDAARKALEAARAARENLFPTTPPPGEKR